jgi:hypothetical protein
MIVFVFCFTAFFVVMLAMAVCSRIASRPLEAQCGRTDCCRRRNRPIVVKSGAER